MNISDLTQVWKKCETKQMANMFEEYMKSLGANKYKTNRKDNTNTYLIDGKTNDWNKVQCYYHKDNSKFGSENLCIILRKNCGNYMIVEKMLKRAFEVDASGVLEHNQELLKEITDEHKPFFDLLISNFSE